MKFLFFSIFFTIISCSQESEIVPMVSIEGRTMGTTYSIKYFPKSNTPLSKIISQLIDERLIDLNNKMSTYLKDSELSKINRSQSLKWIGISKDLHLVLSYAKTVSLMSDGAFDVTIGPLVNLWGFGPSGKREVPSFEKIQETRKRVGFNNLLIDPKDPKIKKNITGLYLDLSSLAKGYGVDLVSELLDGLGVENYFIEIGGEIKTKGQKPSSPWRIAIQAPDKIYTKAQKTLMASNLSIATSGNYRNFFKSKGTKYSHTLDSSTGKPITNKMASATVIDKTSCMKADALATTMMALGPKKAKIFAEKYKIPVLFLIGGEQVDKNKAQEFSSYESTEFKRLFK